MRGKTRMKLLVAALVGLAVVLGGCASASVDTSALQGTWALESFGGVTALTPTDPSVASDLTLQAGVASGNGGVNSFSGTYKVPGKGRITFGPLAATAMAGPPAATDQESKFFAALNATKHYELNAGKLVLSDLGNNTLLVLVKK